MASRPSFVVCCDDAYAPPLLDAVLMRVRVKRNAESQSSMQDVSWPVGLRPSNNSLGLMRDDDAALAYEHQHVLCFAARNRRGRFYIPCNKQNSFGGVPVDNVLLDSGCSSLLLPYPFENGFPPELMDLALCNGVIVSSSRGTGAVHSPVLKIKKYIGGFPCTLADKEQSLLNLLRFHLGSEACNRRLSAPNCHRMLDQRFIDKLNDFLGQIDGRERVLGTHEKSLDV